MKRRQEEKKYSILAVIIYSVILLLVAAGTYIGVRYWFFNNSQEEVVTETIAIQEEEPESQEIEEEVEEVPEEPEEDTDRWEDLVFSKIENTENPSEALINTYKFERLEADNEEGRSLYYSVYSNPETGAVEKIQSIENCGDLFEITDYYYADGNINYVAEYTQAIDVPADISSSDIESRFYFNKDKLVRYIYCEGEKGTEYTIKDMDKYSDGVKEQLDYSANMVLEKAKKTWEDVETLKGQVYIEGYVLDEYNVTLSERPVYLIESNGTIAAETLTDGDGKYSFTVLPNELKEYTVRSGLSDDNYVDIYGIKVPEGSKKIAVPNFYLAYDDMAIPYTVQIFVKDADDATMPLSYADIRFRYGLNAKTGDAFMSGNLGEFGYIAPTMRSGCYTCEVTKEGYETLFFNLYVKVTHQAVIEYAVKELADNEIKAVLSWETNPVDLDLRCFSSNQKNAYMSLVDSVGSITAETINLKNVGTDAYYFYVSDFSDIAIDNYMAYPLTESSAHLTLYNSEGYMGTYYVPSAHAGAVWKPVEIRNGKIIPVNDYYVGVGQNSRFKTKTP